MRFIFILYNTLQRATEAFSLNPFVGSRTRLVGKRHVQARGQDDIVLFLPGGRIGDINVSEGILPSEPFVDLGHGPKIKHSAILAGVAQVGVEVQLLRKHSGCTQLLRELLSQCECGKIAVERGVILSGVIQSTKQIQSGAIVVDDVKAKTADPPRSGRC